MTRPANMTVATILVWNWSERTPGLEATEWHQAALELAVMLAARCQMDILSLTPLAPYERGGDPGRGEAALRHLGADCPKRHRTSEAS